MSYYQFWSPEEKQKLQTAVQIHTNRKGRINWNGVVESFNSKTKQQCKSYYLNVLRQKKDKQEINHKDFGFEQSQQSNIEQIKLILDKKELTPESQELRQIIFDYIACGLDIDEYFNRFNNGIFDEQINQKIQKLEEMYQKVFGFVMFLISYPETDYTFDYGLLAQIYRCLEKMQTENNDFKTQLQQTCLHMPKDSFVHKMSDMYSQNNIQILKDKIYQIFCDKFLQQPENAQAI